MKLAEYLASAAGTTPTRPSSPSVGYPTAGNPATGTPATRPGAYWHYQLQAELEGVLTAAGLTPSATSLTQLTAAIRAIVAQECPSLKAGNGWQKIPGGVIFQWGFAIADVTPGLPVTFPLAFPNSVLSVVASDYLSSAGATQQNQSVLNPTTTGFTAVCSTGPSPASDAFYYLAIGM